MFIVLLKMRVSIWFAVPDLGATQGDIGDGDDDDDDDEPA